MNGLETMGFKQKLTWVAAYALVVSVLDLVLNHQFDWQFVLVPSIVLMGMLYAGDLWDGTYRRVRNSPCSHDKDLLLVNTCAFVAICCSWIGYGLTRYWVASGGLQRLESKLQARKVDT